MFKGKFYHPKFAHGGKCIIELRYDSIADVSTANRVDAGHFASSEEPFCRWDEDGEISSRCTRCHSNSGLPTYLEEGVNVSAQVSSELDQGTTFAVVLPLLNTDTPAT
ncbi:MAG: hypothetical protein J7M39_13235 [Anaerolineae bacterium]|nr:hypothetical protein [Anaerolineae bacterium]